VGRVSDGDLASGEQTSERGNKQASQAGKQTLPREIGMSPVLSNPPSSALRHGRRAVAPLSTFSPLRAHRHRLRAEVGQGGRGIDVVRGVVADGRVRGALTPFFRASIHREEKMPVPPGSLSFRPSPFGYFALSFSFSLSALPLPFPSCPSSSQRPPQVPSSSSLSFLLSLYPAVSSIFPLVSVSPDLA